MITLSFPQQLLRRLKLRACRVCPREYACYMLGRALSDTRIAVDDIWHPSLDEIELESTPCQVALPLRWLEAAQDAAADLGGVVLGLIHTHAYTAEDGFSADPVQSLSDLEAWERDWIVCGIMNVYENERRKRTCGPLALFGRMQQVNIKPK